MSGQCLVKVEATLSSNSDMCKQLALPFPTLFACTSLEVFGDEGPALWTVLLHQVNHLVVLLSHNAKPLSCYCASVMVIKAHGSLMRFGLRVL